MAWRRMECRGVALCGVSARALGFGTGFSHEIPREDVGSVAGTHSNVFSVGDQAGLGAAGLFPYAPR